MEPMFIYCIDMHMSNCLTIMVLHIMDKILKHRNPIIKSTTFIKSENIKTHFSGFCSTTEAHMIHYTRYKSTFGSQEVKIIR